MHARPDMLDARQLQEALQREALNAQQQFTMRLSGMIAQTALAVQVLALNCLRDIPESDALTDPDSDTVLLNTLRGNLRQIARDIRAQEGKGDGKVTR